MKVSTDKILKKNQDKQDVEISNWKIQDGTGKIIVILIALTVVLFLINLTPAFAAYPLITDDASTQGKGNFQLEMNSEFGRTNLNGLTTETTSVTSVLSCGIMDQMDAILSAPYLQARRDDSRGTTTEMGISDITLEVKWRFYEKDGLSMALKPGILLPTGDESKNLGIGKVNYSFFFIATKELEPWAFHLNLGYRRHENEVDERVDIWNVSLASEFNLTKKLTMVGNIGTERNPDPSSNLHPAFILGGFIYSLAEKINISLGVNYGLNRNDNFYSVLAGISLKF